MFIHNSSLPKGSHGELTSRDPAAAPSITRSSSLHYHLVDGLVLAISVSKMPVDHYQLPVSTKHSVSVGIGRLTYGAGPRQMRD